MSLRDVRIAELEELGFTVTQATVPNPVHRPYPVEQDAVVTHPDGGTYQLAWGYFELPGVVPFIQSHLGH